MPSWSIVDPIVSVQTLDLRGSAPQPIWSEKFAAGRLTMAYEYSTPAGVLSLSRKHKRWVVAFQGSQGGVLAVAGRRRRRGRQAHVRIAGMGPCAIRRARRLARLEAAGRVTLTMAGIAGRQFFVTHSAAVIVLQ